MVELTDEEWTTLCAWLEGLRGGEPVYSCFGTELREERCEPAIPPCWNYDWRASTCYDWVAGSRLPWQRAEPSCDATVADYEACMTRLAASVCYLGYPAVGECEELERCRTGMDRETSGDAG